MTIATRFMAMKANMNRLQFANHTNPTVLSKDLVVALSRPRSLPRFSLLEHSSKTSNVCSECSAQIDLIATVEICGERLLTSGAHNKEDNCPPVEMQHVHRRRHPSHS